MIEVVFHPRADDPSWRSARHIGRPLADLAVDDFVFRYFTGDVEIRVDGRVDVKLATPGVPVIDFVLLLSLMRREVDSTGHSAATTSLTQDGFRARHRRGTVHLEYSFSPRVTRVPIAAFQELPGLAFKAAYDLLVAAHPDLSRNRYLASLTQRVQGRSHLGKGTTEPRTAGRIDPSPGASPGSSGRMVPTTPPRGL